MPHRVAVLALDICLPMEIGMPFQVLGCSRTAHLYDLRLCAPQPGPVATTGGFAVVAEHGLDALTWADTVVVPAYRPHGRPPRPVLDALRAAHDCGARLVSICAGAFALAAAGVLDGRRATTHWGLADELARTHPAVLVDPAVLFVDEGEIVTSAGVAAGIDVCLHLLRVDHGAAVANEVARDIVAAPHRDGGQAQFIERTGSPAAATSLAATRTWALARLREPLTVADLARHARMAPRTFARQFVAETGDTPLQWLNTARVERARELLETRDWGVDQVADEAGMGTATNLRNHFRRRLGVSPADYRATFTRAL